MTIKMEAKCIDKQVQIALDDAIKYLDDIKQTKKIRDFNDLYATKSLTDISWGELCRDAKNIGCPKHAFVFMCNLLNKGIYNGDNKDFLYERLPLFNQLLTNERRFNPGFLLCGDKIRNLLIYINNSDSSGESVYSYSYMHSDNPYIKSELLDFLSAPRKVTRYNTRQIVANFEKSFGKYISEIHTYKDFNSLTFFEQISYYKKFKNVNYSVYDNGIRAICCFYRWLVNKYSEYDFFANSMNMTNHLLFSQGLVQLIKSDVYFTTFNPHTKYKDYERYCFIIRGMDNLSTRLTSEDYFTVNLSNLTSPFFRKAMINYIQSATSIIIFTWTGVINYIIDGLKFITKLKSQDKYPNSSLKYMTNQEAVLIKNYFQDENLKISTLNNKIGAIRRFLQWCQDANLIRFDDMFFDYLSQYEEPATTSGHAISDKHLAKINHYIVDDIKTNPEAILMYAIFHIAIQTEFRINQICHLKTDCVKNTVKPGQYSIYTNSKTSRGAKNRYIITKLTYHILMNAIEVTEDIRDACTIESNKDYIFLHRVQNGGYGIITASNFNNYLKKVCKKLGIECYTAANLRDTHMTKAFEHIIRSGKSDIEMGVLSKHKHLDTTKNHYIEMELEKMLEATYGISIVTELIDADSKVVDEIPKNAQGVDADVENGCGKCTSHSCTSTTSLPCLSCKHFITTVKHEQFFKKAISNLDSLILKTTSPHDKEDLVTIKQLHVLYLKAIYKHKEEI